MISKIFVTIVALCLVRECLTKPAAESAITEGRGIGSTLWGWVTYPFSWWGSETEEPPITEQLIAPTPKYEPLESVEIAKHNVTVWCNDQTCTTQKCDKFGCRNTTCNIYDTDLMGECREYNILATSEEPAAAAKPTESLKPVQDKVTEATKALESTTAATVTSTNKQVPIVVEHPLELEAVLSSTVHGKDEVSDNNDDIIIPGQKV